MQTAMQTVKQVAMSDVPLLLRGETGAGKELIARAIHYNSRRSPRMLVTVNCGAIPEELLESELFGHVKGAFTSATADSEGLVKKADGGTLLLDEIGELARVDQIAAEAQAAFETARTDYLTAYGQLDRLCGGKKTMIIVAAADQLHPEG